MASDERLRLDELLVRRGLFASRSRARDAIDRQTVRIAGQLASKPGLAVSVHADLSVDDPARGYVSRAALKLLAGLGAFHVDPGQRLCLDIGASTGGFTEVLLQRGASGVIAIDVGHGQLAACLAGDLRVEAREGLNARDLTEVDLGGRQPEIIVCDVSFISLKLALPPALALAAPGAQGVFLVKPQFEAGRAAIGRGGLLKDPALAGAVAADLSQWLDQVPGWRSLGTVESPIEGGGGNREFLLGGIKDR